MYKELLIRKNSKQEKAKCSPSKKLIPFQYATPTNQICHQRQISPGESQERGNKNEITKGQEKSTNLTVQNEQKRSLELKKINNIQLYSRSEQIKTSTKISKDFLQLIKKQKQKGSMQYNFRSPFQLKKVARIQMSLDQDKMHLSDFSNKNGQSLYKNPEQKHSKQICKDWPIKVKIQKKLIQTHRKKLSYDDYSDNQTNYPTNQLLSHQRQIKNNFTTTFYESKLRRQKSKSNKSTNQTKFTLRDFYTLNPIMCKGDIVSHQQSKATRKYKFRNELAIQLRQLDNQSFLYKL